MTDQVADLFPLENGYFRCLLIESYSERVRCGRSDGRSIPFRMAILDSYSESPDVGDQVAALPLLQMIILDSYL